MEEKDKKAGSSCPNGLLNKLTLRPLVPDQGLKPLVLPALVFNYIGEV